MLNYNSPLLTFVLRSTNAHKFVAMMVAVPLVISLILFPHILEASPGSTWNGEGKSDVGQQMVLESVGQNGGNGGRIVSGMLEFRHGGSKGDHEFQALGSKTVLLVSAHNETVGNPATESAKESPGGQSDKDSKWLHSTTADLYRSGSIRKQRQPLLPV